MDEYIKRDDALMAISYYPIENPEPGDIIQAVLETARKAIAKINAADVAPVRHGRWDDEHKCTVCHNEAFYKISNIRPEYDYDWEENLAETGDYICDIEWLETSYCPNYGAMMDGVSDG